MPPIDRKSRPRTTRYTARSTWSIQPYAEPNWRSVFNIHFEFQAYLLRCIKAVSAFSRRQSSRSWPCTVNPSSTPTLTARLRAAEWSGCDWQLQRPSTKSYLTLSIAPELFSMPREAKTCITAVDNDEWRSWMRLFLIKKLSLTLIKK